MTGVDRSANQSHQARFDLLERPRVIRTTNHEQSTVNLHVVLMTIHEINVGKLVFQAVIVLFNEATLFTDGISDAPCVNLPRCIALVSVALEHDRVGSELGHDVKRARICLQ